MEIHFKKYLILTFVLSLGIIFSFAPAIPNMPEQVNHSIRTGNSKILASYFNSIIELAIIEKEGIYSKNQAEFILSEFFIQNKPISYKNLHNGNKESSQYIISQLTCNTGKFRIYFLMKNINGTFVIHQFRIENENN